MTHFVLQGETTAKPENLSTLEKIGVVFTGITIERPQNGRTPSDLGMPFETHRVASSGKNELEVWHSPHAEARAVVALFHGYHCSKSKLLAEAQAFYDLGCSVLLVDFRGSGGSTGSKTTLGVHEADDVVAVCGLAKQLTADQPLILFGESMGSASILRAIALGGVEPAGAIVECPFNRLTTSIERRFTAMGLPSFPFAPLLLFWGSVQHGMNGFAHNPVEYAAHVTCPVLHLHGEDDKRVSVTDATEIFDSLAGEKRFELFEGVGHESYCRAQPDLWRRHVAQFLDRVCAR